MGNGMKCLLAIIGILISGAVVYVYYAGEVIK